MSLSKAFGSLLLFASFSGHAFAQTAPFTDAEVNIIRGYFESNINYAGAAPGFVVASPDGTDPDYVYHWQRDAGISMNTLQFTAPNSSTFDERFQNYVEWVLRVQVLPDPNGIDVLGEPKFNTDGSVYSGGWCRPQNDGPASRAIALTGYALWLVENNRTDYVKEYLYTPGTGLKGLKTDSDDKIEEALEWKLNDLGDCSSVGDAARVDCGYNGIDEPTCEGRGCCWGEIDNNPDNDPWCYYPNKTQPTAQPTTPAPTAVGSDAIKTDLNFVADNWDQTSSNCDLWEEQTGEHWYTYMVQRHALIYGAQLATFFGDDDVASSWTSTAASIVPSIESFDNGTFISEGTRSLDCSIIVGTLYGGSDGIYPPTNYSVLNTMSAIQDYFYSAFAINAEDTSNNVPGVLVGRYVSDTYTGCQNNGGSQGHAWILCTNALGDVYYRNSMALAQAAASGAVDEVMDARRLRVYAKIVKRSFPKASADLKELSREWKSLSRDDKINVVRDVAGYMATTGDDQLLRIKYHTQSCDYHMSEQICETTGAEVGAYDLTWAYGTFLSAWYYRGEAIAAGAVPAVREIEVDWTKFRMVQTEFEIAVGNDTQCAGCTGQC